MRYVCVRRFDGHDAVCDTDSGISVRIMRSLLPESVRLGDAFKVKVPLNGAEDIASIDCDEYLYRASEGARLRRKHWKSVREHR